MMDRDSTRTIHEGRLVDSHESSKPLPVVIGGMVRVVRLAIAVAGLLGLIGDIRAINRVD
jgi:hypothetical protein